MFDEKQIPSEDFQQKLPVAGESSLVPSSLAIPPTISMAPEPELPKIVVETPGETAGDTWSAGGGVPMELLRRLPLLCSSRQGQSPQQFRQHSPSTPSFPGSFPSSLHISFR